MGNAQEFPALDQFLMGTFHQDMDLEADTIDEAVAGFAISVDEASRTALLADIDRFERRHAADMTKAFAHTFSPDIDPLQDGRTAADFFASVRRAMEEKRD